MFPQRTRCLLLIELLVAGTGAALGGWATIPYSTVVLVLVIVACFALFFVAVRRALGFARQVVTNDGKGWLPLVGTLAAQPLCWLALVLISTLFDRLGNMARFEVNRPAYERAIASAAKVDWPSGIHALKGSNGGVLIDKRETVRIQLETWGLFSNWEAVVYDPSGAVGEFTSYHADVGDPKLRNLFGDFRLTACEPMAGKFYHCQFD
jgi:hypothetical protein